MEWPEGSFQVQVYVSHDVIKYGVNVYLCYCDMFHVNMLIVIVLIYVIYRAFL